MTDLSKATIDTLLSTIEDLKRRVSDLERGNALVGALPRGATITVLDPADGSALVRLGTTTYGLGAEFFDDTGNVITQIGDTGFGKGMVTGFNPATVGSAWLAVGPEGIKLPYIAHGWQQYSSPYVTTVTTPTWATSHRCVVELLTYHQIKMRAYVVCDAATTAKVRVQCQNNLIYTDEVSCPAGQTSVEWNWDLNLGSAAAAVAPPVVGTGPVSFDLQVTRMTGAGNVNVFLPTSAAVGLLVPTATATGH